jgi:hypothetical protein
MNCTVLLRETHWSTTDIEWKKITAGWPPVAGTGEELRDLDADPLYVLGIGDPRTSCVKAPGLVTLTDPFGFTDAVSRVQNCQFFRYILMLFAPQQQSFLRRIHVIDVQHTSLARELRGRFDERCMVLPVSAAFHETDFVDCVHWYQLLEGTLCWVVVVGRTIRRHTHATPDTGRDARARFALPIHRLGRDVRTNPLLREPSVHRTRDTPPTVASHSPPSVRIDPLTNTGFVTGEHTCD